MASTEKKAGKGIRAKLLAAFIRVLIITLIVSFAVSEISMVILRQKSEDMLIEQQITSASDITRVQAENISEDIKDSISTVHKIATYTEYLYNHADEIGLREIPTTYDVPDDAEGNQLYWLYFDDADAGNREIEEEAYLLGNLEPELESVMSENDMIISIYVATKTHINIGYDTNAVTKKPYGAYNPITYEAKWYIEPMDNGETYISDTYADYIGRGLEVTIAVPYTVNGELHGVIGADIVIENINKNILNIYTGMDSGYGLLFAAGGSPICAENMTEETTAVQLLGCDDAVNQLTENSSGVVESTIGNNDVYISYYTIEATGWKLALVLSKADIIAPAEESNSFIVNMNIIQLALAVILLLVMYLAVNRRCNRLSAPILTLTENVSEIGDGNLDYVSKIDTGDEIQSLSEAFEQMTVSLKQYISNLTSVTAEKERIGAELDVAAHIQSSMLPCIFPAFPERDELDIYATMTPAKEVGGDFYDFFMVDERHVAIVMADVSGKGVPAALFMVIGKTLIKDHTLTGKNPGEVFSIVNNMLCEANSEGLFITAFEGVLDLVTGEFVFVNAGHEMPFICKKGDKFAPYKIRAGFVLAGMEDMNYRSGSITLEPGDKIFQYTDGVTEATSAVNELYGMDRLERILSSVSDKTPEEILPAIKSDIDFFVGDAPQFDDITMLCLEYKKKMRE